MATGWLDKLVGASPQDGEETMYDVSADQSCRVPADQGLRAALAEAHDALAASRENEDRLRLLVDQARDYLSDAKDRIQAAETRAEALQAELDELRASDRQGSTSFVTMDGYEAELKNLRALLDGAASCSGPSLKANEAG
jgi:small-conductance mechanosensitive channel